MMTPDQLSEKLARAQAALPSEERGRDKITAVARFRLTAAQDVIELAAAVTELENRIKAMGQELERVQADRDALVQQLHKYREREADLCARLNAMEARG